MGVSMMCHGIIAPAYAGGENAQTQTNAASPLPAYLSQGLVVLDEVDDPDAMRETIEQRMAAAHTPGMAVAVIRDGQLEWVRGFGTNIAGGAQPIDKDSVFSAGSVSKLVNAALILRLVEIGVLDLDRDVNSYLTSWQVPESEFTAQHKVTLRRLLSHTAGTNLHGFPDFLPGEPLPNAVQTLGGLPPAKHDPVTLLFEPGSALKYSGGGITISQLVVSDVTGLSYEKAASKYVFEPLGMTRSTFANPLPEDYDNIAYAHDREGNRAALPRGYEAMPEMAASGLWVSAADMAKFMSALLGDETFLSPQMRSEIFNRQVNSWHGLGPRINGEGANHVVHHGGANNSYQTWFEVHPASGDGLIVLTNSGGGRALAYEVRITLERDLAWSIRFPDHFEVPEGIWFE